jgi:hemolysin activation/secretion protein
MAAMPRTHPPTRLPSRFGVSLELVVNALVYLRPSRVALAAALIAVPAFAQDIRQGAPKQLPTEEPRIEVPADLALTDDGEDVVYAAALKGITFIDRTCLVPVNEIEARAFPPNKFCGDTLDAPGAPAGEGVAVRGVDTLMRDNFAAQIKSQFLGQPLTKRLLDRVSRYVIDYHRQKERPLVDVIIPAQEDATDGNVQLIITEFVVNEIDVAGNKYFSSENVRNGLRLKAGDRIDAGAVVRDLNGLNSNPFRRVDLIYRRADVLGRTDITMRVTDRNPRRFFVGYENNGTPLTGRDRYFAGFNFGNLWGEAHQASYQFSTSEDIFNGESIKDLAFQSHAATYLAPLPWLDTLLFFGTYQRATPTIVPVGAPAGVAFDQTGENIQLSARYIKPLRSGSPGRQQIAVGYDFKQSDNNLLFGGTSVSANATQIHQARIEYSGTRYFKFGTLSVGNELTLSPGGIGRRNTDAAFRPSGTQSGVPEANASYIVNRLTISQSFNLPARFSFVARAIGQVASSNLLPSEQLPIAGAEFVRGYDPNAIIGAEGYLLRGQLFLPDFNPLGRAGIAPDRMQFGLFYDHGYARDVDRVPGTTQGVRTEGAGISFTYDIRPALAVRLDYGWQLRALPGSTGAKGELGAISVTLGF